MGRWTVHRHDPNERFFFIDDGDNLVISNLTKSEATIAADTHNADCDSYEARIAELETVLTRETLIGIDARKQLARVKAESLRVVVDGEAVSVDSLPVGISISIPDRTGVYRRVGSGASAKPEPHSFVILEDCNSGEEINVPYGTQGYVVRLERWEDEG